MTKFANSKPRLFMLGIDSMSMPFAQEHLDRLPTLSRLLDRGKLIPLKTPATYLSAAVWPTFSSGKHPGFHGQYYPMQFDPGAQRFRKISNPIWSDTLRVEPFWYDLARNGVETIMFDIPHIFKDANAPCLQIINYSAQSFGTSSSSKPEVLKQLWRRFGRRPIGAEVPLPKNRQQCQAITDRMIHAVRAKTDAILYLMDRPWDLFLCCQSEVHRAGHNLWPVEGDVASEAAPDALLNIYIEADRQLARVIDKLESIDPDANLVLFALHGLEPNRVQDHFLSEILNRLNRLYLGLPFDRRTEPRSPNLFAWLRQRIPFRLQYRAAQLLGEHVQDWFVNRCLVGGRDWQSTPAFPILSGGEGLIRFNIKGRERDGFFEPGSQALHDYSAWLRDRLLAIRVHGTDVPLVAEVVELDQVYNGPRSDLLPDLAVQWAPEAPVDRIFSDDIGEIQTRLATGRGGNHNDLAFLISVGDAEFCSAAGKAESIMDFAGLATSYYGRA